MAAPPTVTLSLAHDEQVARLTYAEPRLNLINSAGMDELLRAAETLHGRDDLRLVVLTGAGERAFVGGADIAEMAALDPVSARAFIMRLHEVCHLFRSLPVPSIALVRGYCLGAGMELAAACDLRLGSSDSRYGMPEVQVGLPSVIEAALLPSLVGWGKTRELLYTGAVIDAAEAERIGFLQRVAPPEALDEALDEWTRPILAAEPGAVRAQKRLVEGWLETGVAAGVQAGVDAFADTFRRPAAARRLRAFLQRPRRR